VKRWHWLTIAGLCGVPVAWMEEEMTAISPEMELRVLRAEVKRLRELRDQVLKAAGDLEGLPDGHAFEMIWWEDDLHDDGAPEDDKPPGIITVGMLRRAAGRVDGG